MLLRALANYPDVANCAHQSRTSSLPTRQLPYAGLVPEILIITVSGPDQPGVTAGLTHALASTPVALSQVEQIVLQGHLVLGLAISPLPGQSESCLPDALTHARAFAQSRNLEVDSRVIDESTLSHDNGRVVVTVLGSPLLPASVAAITTSIATFGGNIERIRQVASQPVTAVEFEVGGVAKVPLRQALATVARANKIDIAVQDSDLDRRGVHLVVMDVDSTFIQEEVIELLAARAGKETEVRDITHRAMNGELDFAESLRARVAMLKGLSTSVFQDVLADIHYTPGAATLCRTLQRLGYHVALVSGGFTEVVQPLAEQLEVKHFAANALESIDGVLTGNIVGPIVDRAAKAELLEKFANELNIPLTRTVAIGDGANDLDMLHAAGLGIAFNAKPYVRDLAHASVNTPYLDTVLYLLGITREHIERAETTG